jgi:hypothetical protein
MERIPLHSWEMEFSIQYHVTINSQLIKRSEFNTVLYIILYYIILYYIILYYIILYYIILYYIFI